MNNVMEEKIIFTTGGTGGHIYPALAIAKEFKKRGSSILFVGTKHRMEREIVPNEGYDFIGLDVLPLRSIKSFIKMLKAIKDRKKKFKGVVLSAFGDKPVSIEDLDICIKNGLCVIDCSWNRI